MKVDLTGITTHQCSVHTCLSRRFIQRHHRGCEKMWLRHFSRKGRSQRYQDFKARYHEFREEDIAPLCKDHHLELHRIYAPIISAFVVKKSFRPCKDWTWDEAEELMAVLRQVCTTFCAGDLQSLERLRCIGASLPRRGAVRRRT